MGHTRSALEPLTDSEFRRVVGHFASGVTVVTTADAGKLYGTTASAFSSLSVEPFSVLVCLNKTSTTKAVIERSGYFAVNILDENSRELAKHFASKAENKLESVAHERSAHGGVPILRDALATIVCEVMDAPVGGTHTVYFGRALETRATGNTPLVYYRGRFGRFEEFER